MTGDIDILTDICQRFAEQNGATIKVRYDGNIRFPANYSVTFSMDDLHLTMTVDLESAAPSRGSAYILALTNEVERALKDLVRKVEMYHADEYVPKAGDPTEECFHAERANWLARRLNQPEPYSDLQLKELRKSRMMQIHTGEWLTIVS